jgi:hypothetical protein
MRLYEEQLAADLMSDEQASVLAHTHRCERDIADLEESVAVSPCSQLVRPLAAAGRPAVTSIGVLSDRISARSNAPCRRPPTLSLPTWMNNRRNQAASNRSKNER